MGALGKHRPQPGLDQPGLKPGNRGGPPGRLVQGPDVGDQAIAALGDRLQNARLLGVVFEEAGGAREWGCRELVACAHRQSS